MKIPIFFFQLLSSFQLFHSNQHFEAIEFVDRQALILIFPKGRTIRKVMGGEGNFWAAGIFFRYQIPCMNFF